MPELPEVETVRQVLRKNILGQVIAGIDIYYEKMIHNISIEEFKKTVIRNLIVKALFFISIFILYLNCPNFVKTYVLQPKEV